MSQPTAVIKVICQPQKLQETANLLAWTVGHHVEIAEAAVDGDPPWLLVFTDLAYHDDDDTILEHLGLDIIGKLGGVLSWTVVPSDQSTAPSASQELFGDAAARAAGLEDQLTQLLSVLPVPVSIMKRTTGKYAWKWQNATGLADTFSQALTSVLTLALRSYRAIQSELEITAPHSSIELSDVQIERELLEDLVALPTPVLIMPTSDGQYLWKWQDTSGSADSFLDAVTCGLTTAMASYADVREKLIGA